MQAAGNLDRVDWDRENHVLAKDAAYYPLIIQAVQ